MAQAESPDPPAADPAVDSDLRRSASRLQAIVDTAVDGIITIDEHGIVESFNPAAERMFQYSAREVIGENLRMLMPSPDREQHDGYLQRYKRTGERRILGIGREVVGQRKDGSTFPMYLAVGETWLDDGWIFAGILRDLTDEKAREAQLQQTRDELLMQSMFAERLSALAELSGGIAHELNQPLSGVRVYAETAKSLIARGEPADLERARQSLDKLIGQVDRAATTIRHMRDFAAEPTSDESGSTRDVSVYRTVERLREIIGEQLKSHGIELQNDVDPDLTISFQASRLEQVLLNLVTNARDSILEVAETTAPRRIRIRSGVDDEARHVWVGDTGAGVRDELRESMFHPFVTSKRPNRGTGLGLSICHGILRREGASVALESTGPGGTVIRLTFPTTPRDVDA